MSRQYCLPRQTFATRKTAESRRIGAVAELLSYATALLQGIRNMTGDEITLDEVERITI
jgi:hypothetical protein